MVIEIMNKDTGESYGTISESDLQVLEDVLEEESSDDQDYWVDSETVELLEREGASDELLDVLRRALESREGVELAWAKAA